MNLRVSTTAAPVRQQVAERLRAAIIECRFERGGRLVERELCSLMGVSRSSVREALRQLEAEGLVTLIPNAGPMVASPTVTEAKEIYEVRAVLEGLAGRLFVERASDSEVDRLARVVERMEKACCARDITALHKAKTRFYEVLAKGCRNEVLADQLTRLRARVALVRGTSLDDEARADESLIEIQRILKAIQRRDPEATYRACIDHIREAATLALAILGNSEAPLRVPRRAAALHGRATS